MYEYLQKRHIAASHSGGLGADRYVLPSGKGAPYAFASTTVQDIGVICYENMPREEAIQRQVPYLMELSAPGHHFMCIGNPTQTCPESVHRGADPKDPWRQRRCAAWRETWQQQAADLMATEDWRKQVTENVLNVAGITGWRRWFTKPAEFIQVLSEREGRERAIKIAAIVALAAGGGVILWTHLKDRNAEKA